MTKESKKSLGKLTKNLKSFSLVELIIVIAIIAILSVAGFMILTKWIGKSRDSRRVSDLETIQKVLTYNYMDIDTSENYPLPDDNQLITGNDGEKLWYQGVFGDEVVKNVSNLSKAPKDPNGYNYEYSVTADQKTWEVYAILEGGKKINYIDNTYAKEGEVIKRGNYKGYIMGETGSNFILYNPASMYLTSGTQLTTGSSDYIYQENENVGASQTVTGMIVTGGTDISIIAENFGITEKEAKIAVNDAANGDSVTVKNNDEEINGQCGPAHASGFITKPTTNLCNVGIPSNVSLITGSSNIYERTCNGENGGNDVNCSADYQTTKIHDIFQDGSAIATYNLDSDAIDLGGNYDGNPNNVVYGGGRFGEASNFNGNSSYINLLDLNSTNFPTEDLSLSLWVKASSIHKGAIFNGRNYYYKLEGYVLKGRFFFTDDGYIEIKLRNNDGQEISKKSFSYNTGQWYHISYVFDESTKTQKFYVDGIEMPEFNVTSQGDFDFVDGKGHIGVHNYHGSSNDVKNSYFDGYMDQVRIFNRALTSGEVEMLYNEK